MTITETHETLIALARAALEYRVPLTALEEKRSRDALRILTPRVMRMRARLDELRARRAGRATCPKWAIP